MTDTTQAPTEVAEVFDSSDPKAVKDRKKDAKNRELRNKGALQSIMQTPAGRAWVHALLVKCSPGRTPFSTDPIQMAFNCGAQNIGLELIADLHAASTELYLVMMKENSDG